MLAVGLSVTTLSAANAAPTPSADGATSPTVSSVTDQARGNKCATRKEYKRIKAKGKRRNRSSLRQVRRIMDFNGKRQTVSHTNGHKWEIRKYRHCGSRTLHVYVNFKDNRAYYKTGKP